MKQSVINSILKNLSGLENLNNQIQSDKRKPFYRAERGTINENSLIRNWNGKIDPLQGVLSIQYQHSDSTLLYEK